MELAAAFAFASAGALWLEPFKAWRTSRRGRVRTASTADCLLDLH
jgi:hypothetical protein